MGAEQHLAVRAGPASCPLTTPAPFAQCELHATCEASGHSGFCCPNLDGHRMDCCDQEVINASGSIFGMNTRASDFSLVGASADGAEESNNFVWVLLVALAVVLCGCCLIGGAFCSRGSKSRTLKIPDSASDAHVTQDSMTESLAEDVEAQEEKASLMSSENGKPLPFPNVGLPSGKLLPFPDV